MPDDNEEKGYSVVDKRGAADEPRDESSKDSGGARGEDREDRTSADQPPPEDRGRMMKVQEFMILFLNLLRDQAALNLGMPLHPGVEPEKSPEKAEFIVGLSVRIMERFGEKIFAQAPQIPKESFDLSELILSYLAMLQEYILIYMGVLANPVTGLVAKELEQARLGIDFFALILDECSSTIPPGELKRLKTVLSDLQLNFARQSGL
ncbi:MAG: hypothetical protein ABIH66_00590 [bacterium]